MPVFVICRNLTERQRELIEEFSKEEQGEFEKERAASASGWNCRRVASSHLLTNHAQLGGKSPAVEVL